MRALALALLVAGAAPLLRAEEVVVFVNGDRLSGTIAAKGTKRVRFKTPYGLLAIPRTQIERLIYADGREEVITPPPPPAAPPPPVAELDLKVAGDTFWQAWKPETAPADPSLRLSIALDGETMVTYEDASLDPGDLPGAVVNSFLFAPDRLFVRSAPAVKVRPPEPGAGGVRLVLELPPEMAGAHRLTLAYEVNDATSAAPQWAPVTEGEVEVALATDRPTLVRVLQDRGEMEFHRGSMRRVDTFRLIARVASAP
jgi:hypothetical protein